MKPVGVIHYKVMVGSNVGIKRFRIPGNKEVFYSTM